VEKIFAVQPRRRFPISIGRLGGKLPLSPDTLLKKVLRPALKRAGIEGKTIGWHSFRHSLATNLRAADVDLKTAQELLRHANSRITHDVYIYERSPRLGCVLILPLAINLLFILVYDGDDGARTRDLCRDSTEAGSNLLKLRVTDGIF
jgi:hypothetical protein